MSGDAFAGFERAGWERTTPRYEEYWTDTVLFVEPFLDAAGVGAGSRLLDVPCGPGFVSEAAAARGAHPVGVHIATAMVERARMAVPTSHSWWATWLAQGNAQERSARPLSPPTQSPSRDRKGRATTCSPIATNAGRSRAATRTARSSRCRSAHASSQVERQALPVTARLTANASSSPDQTRHVSQPLPYSSWRRNHGPVSLRPFGARSSHWYMPQRTSTPRA